MRDQNGPARNEGDLKTHERCYFKRTPYETRHLESTHYYYREVLTTSVIESTSRIIPAEYLSIAIAAVVIPQTHGDDG